MLLKLHQLAGGNVQDLEVSDNVFGIKEINDFAVAQVVRWQLQILQHRRELKLQCSLWVQSGPKCRV